MEKYCLSDKAKIVFETPKDASYFFGYYDKSPLDITNRFLLTHKVDFDGRDITANDEAEIGIWDIHNKTYKKVTQTKAFNWQQGSMLQWLPPYYKDTIIYNDRQHNQFVSVILNTKTNENKIIPFPIYCVHPNGKSALSINYERFYFIKPGYNYQGIVNKKWDKAIHSDDGIYSVDLATGKYKLLIRLEDIVDHQYLDEFATSRYHFIEMPLWNPDGTRFLFLHRWLIDKNNFKTRLFSCDISGKDLYLFPDMPFVSHYNWKNNNEFTVWAAQPNSKTKLIQSINNNQSYAKYLRPIYQFFKTKLFGKSISNQAANSGFLSFIDKSSNYSVIGKNILTEDGHNNWTKDERYMLTDTYQDKDNFRRLLLYDSKNKTATLFGKFYSEYNNCGFRCDLHPRFSLDEKYVIIDSAHNKHRGMKIISL
jgi:hypothetical protein